MKHSNIAVFIPHLGCPHRCSFCDQQSISGAEKAPTPLEVELLLDEAVPFLKNPAETEIAFFGGSFTAVDRGYMTALLEVADHFVKRHSLAGVRVSTRPDAIDDEILDVLKRHSVRVIELGAQSMDDSVLRLNCRGHTAKAVRAASRMIQSAGFALGLQMMTGLYGSTPETDWKTAKEFVSLGADMVRIYPTLTLKGTYLEQVFSEGSYRPQTLDEAVGECAGLLRFFEEQCVPVIRLGLHPSKGLEQQLIAGPYHPAFRELCESQIMLENARKLLKTIPYGAVKLCVAEKSLSKMTGQKKCNIKKLKDEGYEVALVPAASLREHEIKLV